MARLSGRQGTAYFSTFLMRRGRAKEWRGVGLTTASFIGLFTVSLFLDGLFPIRENQFGNYLLSRTGLANSEAVRSLSMAISSVLIVLGFWIFSLGWKEIYRGRGELVTTGLYAIMRHPQYLGLILIVGAFPIRWPTLLMLFLTPFFIAKYVLLSKTEDRELEKRFGENFRSYKERVPGFIPSLIQDGEQW
ncbi:MAG: methyltransferase family protein [Candidatus Binatia bacterium]